LYGDYQFLLNFIKLRLDGKQFRRQDEQKHAISATCCVSKVAPGLFVVVAGAAPMGVFLNSRILLVPLSFCYESFAT
jgi:hypothetical protein